MLSRTGGLNNKYPTELEALVCDQLIGNMEGQNANKHLETILVVDDEEVVRDFCESVLTRAGYHVLLATSGEQALKICIDPNRAIGLLLVDVVMPGMNGVTLVKHLNDQKQNTKIAMMSGYSPDSIRHLIVGGGAIIISFGNHLKPSRFYRRLGTCSIDLPPSRAGRQGPLLETPATIAASPAESDGPSGVRGARQTLLRSDLGALSAQGTGPSSSRRCPPSCRAARTRIMVRRACATI